MPLLLQLRRTAAAVQHLADSARQDLQQIAADVHHIRATGPTAWRTWPTASLELPLRHRPDGFRTAQDRGASWAGRNLPWMGALLTGLKFVLNLFRRPRNRAATKEASHE